MEKIAELKPDAKEALGIIDDLRKRVASGEIIAFAVVGIEPDDTTRMWTSCTKFVSRLRTIGAISTLLHHYTAGDC